MSLSTAILAVKAVFIPTDEKNYGQLLADNSADLIIGAVPVTAQHLRTIAFAPPYMDVTAAFAVPDHKRHLFADLQTMTTGFSESHRRKTNRSAGR